MTATQSNLAGLSRFIFTAPRWYRSLAFALLVAAIAGVAAFDSGHAERTWRGLFFIGKDAWEGIFFIGIPTIVASVATTGVDRFFGGKLTHNRSSLLALTCELIVVAIVTAAAIAVAVTSTLSPVFPVPVLGQPFVFDALVIALASIFAFRLLIVMAVSRSSLLVATVPASVQTLTSALLLFVYSGTVRFLEIGGPLPRAYLLPYLARADRAPPELLVIGPNHFFLLGVTCLIYAGAVYAFVRMVDRPWRQSLGVSVLDFLRGFIGHVAEGSDELEEFFEQLGEEAVVPVSVLSFKRPDGTEKARWVLPMIHPGPMGDIGGGNFPERLARRSEGLAFAPHATAGHDFNLVTEREIDAVLDAADTAYERITYSEEASTSVRVTANEATVTGQGFGDDALLVATFAPAPADDIEYAVGLTAAAEARTRGPHDVLVIDAHNCNDGLETPELGHVTPGSKRSFDLIGAVGLASESVVGAERGRISLGVAWDETSWTLIHGIGPLGIRVAVVEVAGELTAYVLIDGNNMEPGLRDQILAELTEDDAATHATRSGTPAIADGAVTTVDRAEVMTTDTHVVNIVDADNRVGAAIDADELVALVARLVDEAVSDLEPVSAGMATQQVEVTVFGNDRTESLASHANVAISMGGALAAAVILAAVAVSVLVFFLA